MAKLQPPRGTRDLFGDELARHRHVARVAEEVARTYGFAEIETPVFEAATVFDRSLGETSDVVSKEMYSFKPARMVSYIAYGPKTQQASCGHF